MHKNHTCIVFYVVLGKMNIYVFTFRVQILSIYCKIRQFSLTKISSYCMIHTGSILVSKHMCTIVVLKFYIQNSKCFTVFDVLTMYPFSHSLCTIYACTKWREPGPSTTGMSWSGCTTVTRRRSHWGGTWRPTLSRHSKWREEPLL